jgi:hypothetical protein
MAAIEDPQPDAQDGTMVESDEAVTQPIRRGPGRPRGSKNKNWKVRED